MRLEEVIDAQLAEPQTVGVEQMRDTQDQLFALRRDAPLVPEWFYNAVAGRFEDDMRFAAAQRAKHKEENDGYDI